VSLESTGAAQVFMPAGRQPVTLETSSSLMPPSVGESRISMLPVAAIDC